jgi:hypothetical protein
MTVSFGTLENTVRPNGKVLCFHPHPRERSASRRYIELDGDRRLCRLVQCGPRGLSRRQVRPPRRHPRKRWASHRYAELDGDRRLCRLVQCGPRGLSRRQVRPPRRHPRKRWASHRYAELDGDRRLCRLVECGPRRLPRRQVRPPRRHPRKHRLSQWEGSLFSSPSSKTLGVPSLCRVRRRPPIMSIGGVWAARALAAAGSASEGAASRTLGVPSLYRVRRRPPIMSIGGVRATPAFAAAGSASEGAASKTPLVLMGRFSVFIPIVARPGGQGTRLKLCADTARRVATCTTCTEGRLSRVAIPPALPQSHTKCRTFFRSSQASRLASWL